MQVTNTNLLEFLGAKRQSLHIPVFQRKYNWSKTSCEKLFYDLKQSTENEIDHFLGVIVNVVAKSERAFTKLLIIDGQQRMTSLSLLLLAIYNSTSDDELQEEIKDFLINLRQNDDKTIKLQLGTDDAAMYSLLLSEAKIINPSSNTSSNNINSVIQSNYTLFKNLIKDEQEEFYFPLFKAICDANLVCIDLEDSKHENPQLIFQSLNSTGSALTAADLIRNFLLLINDIPEQTRLYNEYWQPIEQNIKYSKISNFIQHYVIMKQEKKVATDEKIMYSIFQEVANKYKNEMKNKTDCSNPHEDFLDELLTFSKYYATIVYLKNADENLKCALRYYHTFSESHFSAYPFLFYIFHEYENGNITAEERLSIIHILTSYIVRRQICEAPSQATTEILYVLIHKFKERLQTQPSYTTALLEILSEQTDNRIFPRNKIFKDKFIHKKIYQSNNTKFSKYILFELEFILAGKEQINFTSDITIEHIMPQKLSFDWNKLKEIHNTYLHTIGNLTFTGYNQNLGNKKFADKQQTYKNSNIAIYRQLSKYDKWDQDSITERAEALFEIALTIWSLPEKFDTIDPIELRDKKNSQAYADFLPLPKYLELDLRSTKPATLKIFEIEYDVKTWVDMLKVLCQELFIYDSTRFYQLLNDTNYLNKNFQIKKRDKQNPDSYRYIIHNQNQDFVQSHTIGDGDDLFIETKLKPIEIIKYSILLCRYFEILTETSLALKKPAQLKQNSSEDIDIEDDNLNFHE